MHKVRIVIHQFRQNINQQIWGLSSPYYSLPISPFNLLLGLESAPIAQGFELYLLILLEFSTISDEIYKIGQNANLNGICISL